MTTISAVLEPQHAVLIQASGIAPEVVTARGYRTVTKKSEMRDLGFGESQARVPALLIPIHNVMGEVTLYQARPDVPRIKDGKALKYETPLKARMVLDVPPGARQQLGNPAVPLFVTEGVRKADAAVSHGLCCVALLGVWNWRGTNEDGGKVALPEWESVALNGRQTYIIFDSDVTLKPQVHGALSRLKAFLGSRGANVAMVYLPTDGGAKVGLDDYLAAGHGVHDLLALATPMVRPSASENSAEEEKPAKGRPLQFEEVEPSARPVDGAALLDDIASTLETHIVLPAGAAVAIALWTAHTYLMGAWDVTPLLAISSPTKRCGKTSLLRVIRGLVRRPLPASGISAAAIYRTVEEHEPTLLIDEMDSMKENEDLRGVLNSGHTRDLAFVIRVVGDGAKMEPRRFSTWCPKVLAHIGRLPGTLEDRAIRVPLRRKLPGERRERIRRRRLDSVLRPICGRIARWAQDVADLVTTREPVVPADLDDRAADNWEPLLVIADAAGGRWPRLARHVAVALSTDRGADEEEDNPGVLLLADLKELLDGSRLDGGSDISGEEACALLRDLPERPWKTWGRGRDGLQPVHLARLLRPFGMKTALVRVPGRRDRRYRLEDLLDATRRYLRHGSGQPVPSVPGPDPFHVNRDGSSAGTAEQMERVEEDGTSRLPVPATYRHGGHDYRVGDALPDGRVVLDIADGVPVLRRRPPTTAADEEVFS